MRHLMNKRGGGLLEALSMAPVVIGLVGWAVWFGIETGSWYWCILMGFILVCVIVMEIIALIMTDRTISQQFWDWSKKKEPNGKRPNVWKAWAMFSMMIVGWAFLMLHLLWKILPFSS